MKGAAGKCHDSGISKLVTIINGMLNLYLDGQFIKLTNVLSLSMLPNVPIQDLPPGPSNCTPVLPRWLGSVTKIAPFSIMVNAQTKKEASLANELSHAPSIFSLTHRSGRKLSAVCKGTWK